MPIPSRWRTFGSRLNAGSTSAFSLEVAVRGAGHENIDRPGALTHRYAARSLTPAFRAAAHRPSQDLEEALTLLVAVPPGRPSSCSSRRLRRLAGNPDREGFTDASSRHTSPAGWSAGRSTITQCRARHQRARMAIDTLPSARAPSRERSFTPPGAFRWLLGLHQTRARDSGLLASMGSIGDCYDNSMIESFWSRMQVRTARPEEVEHPTGWPTRSSGTSGSGATKAPGTASSGGFSPIEFGTQPGIITVA